MTATTANEPRLPPKAEAIARLDAYQERLERALPQGGAAFDDLFDHAPAGIGLHEIDLDKTVTRVNDRELEILGYSREQMLGRPAWTWVVMQEVSQRAVDRKLAGGGLKPFVRTFARADGSPVTVAVVERYRRDKGGAIVGIRTALTPIAPP